MNKDVHAAVRRAAEIAGDGTLSSLATLLGVTPSAISQWLMPQADRVPVKRAIEIEALTGGRVARWQLRPDIFIRPCPQCRALTTPTVDHD